MAGNQGANHYKQIAIKTANRGQLLLMLYEGAIQNVKKAAAALEKKDIAAKGIHIGKAHDIINELSNTLDFEAGGQIAIDLERLYFFMTEQLVKANIENSIEPLKTVEKLLSSLLEAWVKAVNQVNQQKKGDE